MAGNCPILPKYQLLVLLLFADIEFSASVAFERLEEDGVGDLAPIFRQVEDFRQAHEPRREPVQINGAAKQDHEVGFSLAQLAQLRREHGDGDGGGRHTQIGKHTRKIDQRCLAVGQGQQRQQQVGPLGTPPARDHWMWLLRGLRAAAAVQGQSGGGEQVILIRERRHPNLNRGQRIRAVIDAQFL